MDTIVIELIQEILKHAANYQYIQSKCKYDKLQEIIKKCSQEENESLLQGTVIFISKYEEEFKQIIIRANETNVALCSTSLQDHDIEWLFASEYLGVCTHYAIQSDGLIAVHLHGNVENLPFFEQLAVINEIDLFTDWVPFCSSAQVLKRIGRAELLAHFSLSFPMFSRDACLRAYGVDCLEEHDSIVILGESIPTPDMNNNDANYHLKYSSIEIEQNTNSDTINIENTTEDISIPWVKTAATTSYSVFNYLSSIGSHNHMDIKYFRAVFTVESPQSAKVQCVLCIVCDEVYVYILYICYAGGSKSVYGILAWILLFFIEISIQIFTLYMPIHCILYILYISNYLNHYLTCLIYL